MAKDDYFVIVYKLLKYLYDTLKKGERIDPAFLRPGSPILDCTISEVYWKYIISQMYKQGHIDGLSVDGSMDNEDVLIYHLEKTMITPGGIEYLSTNSIFEKVKRALKEAAEIVPLIPR